jgi:hypothetical protein
VLFTVKIIVNIHSALGRYNASFLMLKQLVHTVATMLVRLSTVPRNKVRYYENRFTSHNYRIYGEIRLGGYFSNTV